MKRSLRSVSSIAIGSARYESSAMRATDSVRITLAQSASGSGCALNGLSSSIASFMRASCGGLTALLSRASSALCCSALSQKYERFSPQ